MSLFEIGMLACFGASWPFSIWKSLSTHQVVGKSPIFMVIVIVGYICGILHKILYDYNWVIWLYVLDLLLVLIDLTLYYYYLPRHS